MTTGKCVWRGRESRWKKSTDFLTAGDVERKGRSIYTPPPSFVHNLSDVSYRWSETHVLHRQAVGWARSVADSRPTDVFRTNVYRCVYLYEARLHIPVF